MKESELQKQCLDYLRKTGWMAFKLNNQGFHDAKKDIWRRSPIKGLPDALALKYQTHVMLEFKTKTKQSENQAAFQNEWERHGGKYWLIRSLDELENKLNELP